MESNHHLHDGDGSGNYSKITTCRNRAREIMGKNYFGIDEAIEFFGLFGLDPTLKQLSILSEAPFSEAELEECKDTHVLVAVFPFSILETRVLASYKKQATLYANAWYNREKFANDHGETGWYLIRKTPIPESALRSWHEQVFFVSDNEEIPTARVLLYAILGYQLMTGETLFENYNVCCPDVDSDNYRVFISGMDINYLRSDDYCDERFVITSARKPE